MATCHQPEAASQAIAWGGKALIPTKTGELYLGLLQHVALSLNHWAFWCWSLHSLACILAQILQRCQFGQHTKTGVCEKLALIGRQRPVFLKGSAITSSEMLLRSSSLVRPWPQLVLHWPGCCECHCRTKRSWSHLWKSLPMWRNVSDVWRTLLQVTCCSCCLQGPLPACLWVALQPENWHLKWRSWRQGCRQSGLRFLPQMRWTVFCDGQAWKNLKRWTFA